MSPKPFLLVSSHLPPQQRLHEVGLQLVVYLRAAVKRISPQQQEKNGL